jgi:DNA repair exonuclease SbcCD nuclease subunit
MARILHAADFHMDSPFRELDAERARTRRAEQRDMLSRVADIARRERAELVLLAGDLLDSAASYYETQEALINACEDMTPARVFIAPGNHDYYGARSPYAYAKFPPNAHIFKSGDIQRVDLPELGCRVWGAAFTEDRCAPRLRGFAVDKNRDAADIMVMHGDVTQGNTYGGDYNPVTRDDIANSGLDYLALGHVHTYSGILKSGKTTYAYPGCAEGRGFDETGTKGLIVGEVTAGNCDLRFIPLGGREYTITEADLTGAPDVLTAIEAATRDILGRDIVRVVLTGQFDGRINLPELEKQLSSRFFGVAVRDLTRPVRDMWAGREEDTLRGAFLRELFRQYEQSGDEAGRQSVALAVRYGLSAIDNGEEWSV